MLIVLPKLLSHEQVKEITSLLDEEDYQDGRLTAGASAVKVKKNLQLVASTETGAKANQVLRDIVLNDKKFWNYTYLKEIASFTFSLYQQDMRYGLHLDSPIHKNGQFRTDISMTIHLNAPTDYEGGELIIHSDFGVHTCKAGMGDAIIYPANLLHEVRPVTNGQRLVAITWIQSYVRDPAQRRILLDLAVLMNQLNNENHANALTAEKSFNSLFRMWLQN